LRRASERHSARAAGLKYARPEAFAEEEPGYARTRRK